MSGDPVLRFQAEVYADRVDFRTHSIDTTWQAEMNALVRLRDDISKLIEDGPRKCPLAPNHQ